MAGGLSGCLGDSGGVAVKYAVLAVVEVEVPTGTSPQDQLKAVVGDRPFWYLASWTGWHCMRCDKWYVPPRLWNAYELCPECKEGT